MKRFRLNITLSCAIVILGMQLITQDQSISEVVSNEINLGCLLDSEAEVEGYSFYRTLKEDGFIDANIEVRYFAFEKKGNRLNKNYKYDIIYECWKVDDQKKRQELLNVLEDKLSDMFYEKPPKVILYKDDEIHVFSTWGAVYRDDLYQIQDLLVKKYSMDFL